MSPVRAYLWARLTPLACTSWRNPPLEGLFRATLRSATAVSDKQVWVGQRRARGCHLWSRATRTAFGQAVPGAQRGHCVARTCPAACGSGCTSKQRARSNRERGDTWNDHRLGTTLLLASQTNAAAIRRRALCLLSTLVAVVAADVLAPLAWAWLDRRDRVSVNEHRAQRAGFIHDA